MPNSDYDRGAGRQAAAGTFESQWVIVVSEKIIIKDIIIQVVADTLAEIGRFPLCMLTMQRGSKGSSTGYPYQNISGVATRGIGGVYWHKMCSQVLKRGDKYKIEVVTNEANQRIYWNIMYEEFL